MKRSELKEIIKGVLKEDWRNDPNKIENWEQQIKRLKINRNNRELFNRSWKTNLDLAFKKWKDFHDEEIQKFEKAIKKEKNKNI